MKSAQKVMVGHQMQRERAENRMMIIQKKKVKFHKETTKELNIFQI